MSDKTIDTAKWDTLLTKVGEGLMVRTDSREVQNGDAFVAISGPLRDGADLFRKPLKTEPHTSSAKKRLIPEMPN